MRTESSLAVGVAEVHALGGWGYPAAATAIYLALVLIEWLIMCTILREAMSGHYGN